MDSPVRENVAHTTIPPTPPSTAGLTREPLSGWDRRTWLVVIPLALIVLYAFLPSLDNGFVAWDDHRNFIDNPYFRGLSAAQVKWAWTTSWVGAYQPLAWMLFEVQYAFYQLDPRGYHVISIVLQVACAMVTYALTRNLLVRCQPEACLGSPWACALSAGMATALFAAHPLRVEAVAWVSCQPYLPCIFFSMLSVLAYLRAFGTNSNPRRSWLVVSFFLFVIALLFKAVPVSLPAVLLILDVYPLRRFRKRTEGTIEPTAQRALLEKVPFVMMSLVFMGLAIAAKPDSQFPVRHYDAWDGVARACYMIWFFICKTVLPLDIIALYPSPVELKWFGLLSGLAIVATMTLSAGLFLVRRTRPGLLAAWLSYLVMLAPNSNLIRISEQIAADRYCYMPMLGLVTLTALGFFRLWKVSSRAHSGAAIGLVVIGLGVLLVLTALTRDQCRTWFNSETLWAHALAHGAQSSFVVHINLGNVYYTQGNDSAAAAQYAAALFLGRDDPGVHYNLAMLLTRQNRYAEAEAHFAEVLRLNRDHIDAHNNLGALLSRQKKYAEAATHFAEVAKLSPGSATAHFNLGLSHSRQGKYEAAATDYAEAIRCQPDYVGAHHNLGTVLSRLENYEAAKDQYHQAIRIDPNFSEAYNALAILMASCPLAKFRDAKMAVRLATRACELTQWKAPRILGTLAAAYAESGDFEAAVSWQKTAIELLTDDRQRADYHSRLTLYQAKQPFRDAAHPARPDVGEQN